MTAQQPSLPDPGLKLTPSYRCTPAAARDVIDADHSHRLLGAPQYSRRIRGSAISGSAAPASASVKLRPDRRHAPFLRGHQTRPPARISCGQDEQRSSRSGRRTVASHAAIHKSAGCRGVKSDLVV